MPQGLVLLLCFGPSDTAGQILLKAIFLFFAEHIIHDHLGRYSMSRQRLFLRGCVQGYFCTICSSEPLTPSAAGPVIVHPLECLRRDGVDVKGLIAAVVWKVMRARVAVTGPQPMKAARVRLLRRSASSSRTKLQASCL